MALPGEGGGGTTPGMVVKSLVGVKAPNRTRLSENFQLAKYVNIKGGMPEMEGIP